MKILVTGGAGFIGSWLVDKLIENKHEVIVVDDLSGGYSSNVNKKANFYIGDCRNQDRIDYIFQKEKPEIVYHLACNAAEGKSHFAPIDIFTRAYNSSLNVISAGIRNGMKRIIFTSSAAVYGSITPPFKEDDLSKPEDLYGLAKLTVEETLEILSKVHNFEYVVARPHNVYGPRQNMSDPYRNVVMLWMNLVLKNQPYIINGDGSMQRCYTYVDDLVNGLYKMGFGNVNGEIFNIGTDETHSLKELSDTIQKVSGTIIPPQYLPQRARETTVVVADNSKIGEKLGYETTVSFEEGIKRTWEWCKQQGPQELIYGGIELKNDKMPKNWK